MADAVGIQKVFNGTKRAVYKLTNLSDGTGESAVVKVDVCADYTDPHFGTPSEVSITRIKYDVKDMVVELLWDATTDVVAAVLSGNGDIDAESYGGMVNNAGTGKTGDLLLTTLGAGSGSSYNIELELRRKYT